MAKGVMTLAMFVFSLCFIPYQNAMPADGEGSASGLFLLAENSHYILDFDDKQTIIPFKIHGNCAFGIE